MQFIRNLWNSTRNLANKAIDSAKTLAVGAVTTIGAALGMSEQAQAALPTEATAAFTTISGNITDVLTAAADQLRVLTIPTLTTTTSFINLPMTWQVSTGNPTAGAGDMKVSIFYSTMDML